MGGSRAPEKRTLFCHSQRPVEHLCEPSLLAFRGIAKSSRRTIGPDPQAYSAGLIGRSGRSSMPANQTFPVRRAAERQARASDSDRCPTPSHPTGIPQNRCFRRGYTTKAVLSRQCPRMQARAPREHFFQRTDTAFALPFFRPRKGIEPTRSKPYT